MDTNSFIVEAYFRTEPGHARGVIVSKDQGGRGYALSVSDRGTVQFRVNANAMAQASGGPVINDGQWHHVLAECDRAAGTITLYVDGTRAAPTQLPNIGDDEPLANTGPLLVGKGAAPGVQPFAGEIEFLRIARGTLANARTTIDELYAWQFVNGPFLRDFAGREITDGKRDAGALEASSDSPAAVGTR
jgi:hypothetical protein